MEPVGVNVGDYVKTRGGCTRVRVKAYSRPPPDGEYMYTVQPGTRLGPVEEVGVYGNFITISVDGYFFNIGKLRSNGERVWFASVDASVDVEQQPCKRSRRSADDSSLN